MPVQAELADVFAGECNVRRIAFDRVHVCLLCRDRQDACRVADRRSKLKNPGGALGTCDRQQPRTVLERVRVAAIKASVAPSRSLQLLEASELFGRGCKTAHAMCSSSQASISSGRRWNSR